jgi:hypothetical protein
MGCAAANSGLSVVKPSNGPTSAPLPAPPAGANGTAPPPGAPMVATPESPPPAEMNFDGGTGGDLTFAYLAPTDDIRSDFFIRDDILFNIGQLGEFLAISPIGEVYWRGQRIGRSLELRRGMVSYIGRMQRDWQAVPGHVAFGAGAGGLPRRPGFKRGAPGRIVFMGKDGPVMTITEKGFFLGDKQVAGAVLLRALIDYFDESEPVAGVVDAIPAAQA